jgi:hypothetical protein
VLAVLRDDDGSPAGPHISALTALSNPHRKDLLQGDSFCSLKQSRRILLREWLLCCRCGRAMARGSAPERPAEESYINIPQGPLSYTEIPDALHP